MKSNEARQLRLSQETHTGTTREQIEPLINAVAATMPKLEDRDLPPIFSIVQHELVQQMLPLIIPRLCPVRAQV